MIKPTNVNGVPRVSIISKLYPWTLTSTINNDPTVIRLHVCYRWWLSSASGLDLLSQSCTIALMGSGKPYRLSGSFSACGRNGFSFPCFLQVIYAWEDWDYDQNTAGQLIKAYSKSQKSLILKWTVSKNEMQWLFQGGLILLLAYACCDNVRTETEFTDLVQ